MRTMRDFESVSDINHRFAGHSGSDSDSSSQSESATAISSRSTTPDSIRNTPQMMRRYYRARDAQLCHDPSLHHSAAAGLFEEMERIFKFLCVHDRDFRSRGHIEWARVNGTGETRDSPLAFSRRAVPAGQR